MKIIITEDQYKLLLESTGSNVVEQIMDMSGVKYDGCGFGGRTYDNFGRKHDTVEVYFKLPDEEKLYYRRIHFLTKNNKVVSVDSTGDFRTITDGFRYIPTDLLMGYFIEKAKIYIEKLLPKLYPNDSLKESVIKEESLYHTLLDRIKQDGWAETASLVGGPDNLLKIMGENKKNVVSYLMSFFDDLHVEKRGGEIFLMDHGLPLLHKPSALWGLDVRAYDDYIKNRIDRNLYGLYYNYLKDLIEELIERFPEFKSRYVDLYKDSGLYKRLEKFYMGEIDDY